MATVRKLQVWNAAPTSSRQRSPLRSGYVAANRCADDAAVTKHIVALWLHGRSPHTIRAYRSDAKSFFEAVGKPIDAVSLGDLQGFVDGLSGEATSRRRRVMAIKSLFTFAVTIGAVEFNVGAALRAPRSESRLAERLLSEKQVCALLLAAQDHPRDRVLIRLLYNGGLRVSELVTLRWRSLAPGGLSGAISVTGKGGKTRVVRLSGQTWAELCALRPASARLQDRVFPITAWSAWDRVRRAARRAGIVASPHFLRHSHATHALHRGADVATVRDTLGHASLATTSQYLHARPTISSGDYLML